MFSNLFKIKKKATPTINDLYIGYHHIIIFTINTNSHEILFDKTIAQLMNNKLILYWFRSYYEMENYFEYFDIDDDKIVTSFVIIG